MLYKKKTIAPSYKANSCCSSWGHFMKSETSAVHKWWQMLVPVNSSLNMVVWACCRAAHWLIGLSHSMSPPWCPPFENKRTSFLHSGGALEHWRGSAETTADADFQLLSVNKHPVWCRALYWAFPDQLISGQRIQQAALAALLHSRRLPCMHAEPGWWLTPGPYALRWKTAALQWKDPNWINNL